MNRAALVVVVALLLLALACKKQQDAPPPPAPAISEAEIRRGEDACEAYASKVCLCAETVAALKEPCKLAPALRETVELSMEVALNPQSARADALQAADTIRKAVTTCIQETAKLPAAGCP